MKPATRDQILELARGLIQTKGSNAFSYADIASKLEITKASIHYHFPSKDGLVLEVVQQYRQLLKSGIAHLETGGADALTLLRAYIAFHQNLADQGRLCVCLMLAADLETLESTIVDAVRAYFAENLEWLTGVLEAGRRAGQLAFLGAPDAVALRLQSGVEGALMLARVSQRPQAVSEVGLGLLNAMLI